jgi:hypothetical protein
MENRLRKTGYGKPVTEMRNLIAEISKHCGWKILAVAFFQSASDFDR